MTSVVAVPSAKFTTFGVISNSLYRFNNSDPSASKIIPFSAPIRKCSNVIACLFLISCKWSVITSASALSSLSDPNALIPCTSSGSTTSSCGICGIVNVLTFLFPLFPTVAGAPGTCVGSKLKTPLCSSIVICLNLTDLFGNKFKFSTRP
ncbi:Uncharacterised protein [Wolbachia endosymbiont wPip_Mol of Culex molestus]|nr:Uncharacterised protein [Wolbachia endosymbiont wPip_Mol of Culex molestus]